MQNLPTSSTQWPVSVGGHTTREGMGLQSAALVLAYSCALINAHSRLNHIFKRGGVFSIKITVNPGQTVAAETIES